MGVLFTPGLLSNEMKHVFGNSGKNDEEKSLVGMEGGKKGDDAI